MTDIAINPVTRRVQFTGNTGTGPYAFTFNILQSSDITVYKNNALFTLTTDYTVSIASNGTGSVTTVVALISSDILTIIGGRQLSRTTDFVTAGDLLASSLNEQLDSNVIMSQQLDERFDRSMKAQPGDTNANMNLPLVADRANGFLTFDNSGNVAINTIQNLDLLNLVQLNIGNITIEGDTVSTSSGNGLALSSGDDLEFVVPASNARIYFKRATATAIDWALAGSSSSLRFINNQSGGVFASITSTHLTSSSSTLELRSEGAALTLNSGGSTIPLEHDGTQRGYLNLDTAGTIKIYTGTGTGTLNTTFSSDALTVVGTLTAGALFIGGANISEVELEMLDGITAGTVAASKAVVVDANKDISSFRNLTATGAVTVGSLVVGSADISETELEMLDSITAGTVAASKAVVVDANKDISSFRNLTATGLISDTLNVTGDVLFEDTAVGNSFVIKNTSGSGSGAPDLVLFRRSSSLANGDDLGRLTFRGIDDGYAERDFFSWQVELIEKAANTASAELHLNTHVGGDGSSNKVTFFSSGNIDTVGAYSSKNATGGVLNLQSSDTTITSGSALGTINFSAPNEGSGTDAILVGASITALSEGTFAADNNATELVFKTGASDSASEKMKLTSTGDLLLASSSIAYGTFTAGDAILRSPGQTRGAILSIQTLHSSIDDGDVLGSIQFNAPGEGSDGDSRLVGAAIEAVAEGAFTSTTNPTEILFKTGASEAATTKMTLSSLGNLTLTSTTASTSSTTGSLIVGGGVGIADDLYVGTDLDVAGATTLAGASTTADITFGDNDKAIFGAGSDLQIYHDGSNSYIDDAGTGNLYLKGTNLFLQDADGNDFIAMSDGGAGGTVYIKHFGTTRLSTSGTGIDVTGTVTADGLIVSGSIANIAAAQIINTDTANGTGLFVKGGGTNGGKYSLLTQNAAGATNLKVLNNGDISFYEDTGTTAKFFWDASAESLGIGTSPSKELHVKNVGSNAVGGSQILIEGGTGGYGAGVSFQSPLTGGSLAEMARITADGESSWNTTASTQDAGLRFYTSLDGTVAERMRIDSSGNVKINNGNLQIERSGSSPLLQFTDTGVNSRWMGLVDGTSNFTIYGTNGSTQELTLDSSGNVGIGTSSPSAIVQVGSSTGKTFTIDQSAANKTQLKNDRQILLVSGSGYGTGIVANGGAGYGHIFFETSTNGEAMRIDASGNVGIGTSSPSTNIHIKTSTAGSITSGANRQGSVIRLEHDADYEAGYSGGDFLGGLEFYSGDSSGGEGVRTAIKATIDNPYNTHSLSFYTAPSNSLPIAERMRIDSSGNVGIGVVPDAANGSHLQFDSGYGISKQGFFRNSYYDGSNYKAIFTGGATLIQGGDNFLFYTAPSVSADANQTFAERMRIDASGNVKINNGNLQIERSGSSPLLQFTDTGVNSRWMGLVDGTSNFTIYGTNGSTQELTLDSSGDLRLGVGGSGPQGPKFYGGDPSTGNNGLSIWPEGDGASSVKQAFYVNNTAARIIVRFINPNGVVGAINTDGSATSYATSSDYRLKTDAQPMVGASARVQALNPVNFEWIASGARVDGFLAHEAQAVVPEAVTGTKDAMMDEEYQVSAATGDIYTPAAEAYVDEDDNAVDAVDEVIHSANAEKPETLEDGQQWRETTAAVMGTRSVPDMQGIDQGKMVPLLVASLQEALTEIAALKVRITALEGA